LVEWGQTSTSRCGVITSANLGRQWTTKVMVRIRPLFLSFLEVVENGHHASCFYHQCAAQKYWNLSAVRLLCSLARVWSISTENGTMFAPLKIYLPVIQCCPHSTRRFLYSNNDILTTRRFQSYSNLMDWGNNYFFCVK
jgi:hypothetical protein